MALVFLLGSLVALAVSMVHLHGREFVSAIVMALVGVSTLGAGLELFRASMGE